jgi:DNA-binding beta-propeller fold protein YncE
MAVNPARVHRTKYRRNMKRVCVSLVSTLVPICAAFAVNAQSAANPPLKLIESVPLPGIDGDFDHFTVDLQGNRLFSAAEGHGTVEVFDMRTNEHIQTIGKGVIKEPHSLLYREDLNRLYVVDGTFRIGAVRIYDGKDYGLIKSIDLPPYADWSVYDPATKLFYVNGNGIFVGKADSTVSVIDTTAGEVVGQIKVDDNVITGFALDPSSPNIYTGMRNKKLVAVIDRKTMKVVATWPITIGEGSNFGFMGLDSADHRLFVNTSNHRVTADPSPGMKYQRMVIFDTRMGKELQTVPINEHTDHLQYDAGTKRLFVVAAVPPSVEVFQQIDADHYKPLGEVTTEPRARVGLYVPERYRFYVAVPRSKEKAHILVYQVD